MIKKVLYRNGKFFYWEKGDLHTHFGIVKEEDMNKSKVKSNIGKEFIVMDSLITDQKLRRGPAVMIAKDIGISLVETGVDKNSKVLEAGTGSGFLAITLSRFVKEVISYEKEKKFYEIARKNTERLEIKNIRLRNKDVNKNKEKDLDLIFLDLGKPWEVDTEGLKSGCYLVAYLPTILKVGELVEKTKLIHVKTAEIIEREWHVEGEKLRPKNQMLGHTGFLVYLRKF